MTLEAWVLTCREGIYRRISSLGPAPNNLLSKTYPEPSPKPKHQVLDLEQVLHNNALSKRTVL